VGQTDYSVTFSTSCSYSISAVSGLSLGIIFFSLIESDHAFSDSGVNTNDRVHHLLGHAGLDTESNSLGNLSSVRASDMETKNSVVIALVHGQFNVALSANGGFALRTSGLERIGVFRSG